VFADSAARRASPSQVHGFIRMNIDAAEAVAAEVGQHL